MNHKIENANEIKTFTLAGKAYLTLRSEDSQTRFTYRVQKARDGGTYFVSVLTGPDNTSSYSYLGTLNPRTCEFRFGTKSKIGSDAKSVKAFTWFAGWVLRAGQVPPRLSVWHEGRCGRCARALTVPESIESGYGPECAGKVGL